MIELRGIVEQSEIGFITLMEQMRYCTVGSFYKNPRNPVWVMGSETHLTGLIFDYSFKCSVFYFIFLILNSFVQYRKEASFT